MKKARTILVVAIILALAFWAVRQLTQSTAASRTVSGTIETDEVRVASRYGGRVEKILVQEGDELAPGQCLVELDAAELRARRDYMAALLEEQEHGARTNEIAAVRHELESLQAELDLANLEAKRARELFDEKATSAATRDSAVARVNMLEQNVRVVKARHELLVEGTRPERIAQARAQLAEIDAQVREMKIVVPTNSVLEVLNVKVGDVLPPNREVATLLLPQHLWVRVYVPETWLTGIKIGQQVTVQLGASRDREFRGTVEQINRQAEFTPRNVQTTEERIKQVFGVKIRLPSDTGQLRAGMTAEVVFPNVPASPQ